MAKKSPSDLVSNKKVFHNYSILETYEAGIVLQGTEVKSLRAHAASLQEAYLVIQNTTLLLKGASIAPYSHGNLHNHDERRERVLLMHFWEISKLKKNIKEKGLALVPIAFYLKKGKIKLKFALAKGKKLHDKRAALKEKEHQKDIQRAL